MNFDNYISWQLLTIAILAGVALLLLIALILLLVMKKKKKKVAVKKNATKTYSPVQQYLFKTKFNYELCPDDCDHHNYFYKVTYFCFFYYITYYIYVPACKSHLALAKEKINNQIKSGELCDYTLKIVPKEKFIYEAR